MLQLNDRDRLLWVPGALSVRQHFTARQKAEPMNLSFATVLFATIIAALIAMPTPAPLVTQAAPTVLAKADRLAVRPKNSSCAQQTWPNFETSCLRYTDDRQAVRAIRAVGEQS
jgi:hypothetical protein